MKFLAALGFLTIIPVPRRSLEEGELGRSTGYFPLVGLLLGLLLAGAYWATSLFLPKSVVSALVIVISVLLTGALHLDGFMDTCDGIGGHRTPEERWAVMRDSRAGAFGVIGAVLLVLVKYASLSALAQAVLVTLLFLPAVSRWAMVYAIFAHPYARPSGLGKAFKQGTGGRQLTLATVICVIAAVLLFRLVGLAIMLGVWLVTEVLARYFRRRFAGLTGDCYGAVNEVAEVVALMLVLLVEQTLPSGR